MEKYKLGTLNPIEFEKICRELLSIRFNRQFKSYKEGRDGGFDCKARDDKNKLIYVQCKRYKDFNSMLKSLSKEPEKLSKIDDLESYYVLTSLELSPEQEKKIFNIFTDYM